VARVEGFEPAQSGQQPVDVNGDPVAVGVWGDSSTGIGVFGTSGEPLPNFGSIPANIAGVEGHSYQHPGVFGKSVEQPGVRGESLQDRGVLGRSETDTGVLGVTFAPTVPGERPSASGVRGVSLAGGDGVIGVVRDTSLRRVDVCLRSAYTARTTAQGPVAHRDLAQRREGRPRISAPAGAGGGRGRRESRRGRRRARRGTRPGRRCHSVGCSRASL
jgi:hypothetical protein